MQGIVCHWQRLRNRHRLSPVTGNGRNRHAKRQVSRDRRCHNCIVEPGPTKPSFREPRSSPRHMSRNPTHAQRLLYRKRNETQEGTAPTRLGRSAQKRLVVGVAVNLTGRSLLACALLPSITYKEVNSRWVLTDRLCLPTKRPRGCQQASSRHGRQRQDFPQATRMQGSTPEQKHQTRAQQQKQTVLMLPTITNTSAAQHGSGLRSKIVCMYEVRSGSKRQQTNSSAHPLTPDLPLLSLSIRRKTRMCFVRHCACASLPRRRRRRLSRSRSFPPPPSSNSRRSCPRRGCAPRPSSSRRRPPTPRWTTLSRISFAGSPPPNPDIPVLASQATPCPPRPSRGRTRSPGGLCAVRQQLELRFRSGIALFWLSCAERGARWLMAPNCTGMQRRGDALGRIHQQQNTRQDKELGERRRGLSYPVSTQPFRNLDAKRMTLYFQVRRSFGSQGLVNFKRTRARTASSNALHYLAPCEAPANRVCNTKRTQAARVDAPATLCSHQTSGATAAAEAVGGFRRLTRSSGDPPGCPPTESGLPPPEARFAAHKTCRIPSASCRQLIVGVVVVAQGHQHIRIDREKSNQNGRFLQVGNEGSENRQDATHAATKNIAPSWKNTFEKQPFFRVVGSRSSQNMPRDGCGTVHTKQELVHPSNTPNNLGTRPSAAQRMQARSVTFAHGLSRVALLTP